MFLNLIKDFFLKRIFKKNLHNVKNSSSLVPIQTVGLLLDESYFFDKELLVKELFNYGILENNIKIIVYKDKLKKSEDYLYPTFSGKNFNWKGDSTEPIVQEFVNEKFDLLISYYDVEKAVLLKMTHNSKAQFKVGLSAVDKRLNHLIISTNAENYKVFAHELFRYLKILNKI